MKNMAVTFLGPAGATFSHLACNKLVSIFGLSGLDLEPNPVANNTDIVPTTIAHGGYGVVAIKTRADDRIVDTVETFLNLLQTFDQSNCPINIIGALEMKISFALMRNPKHQGIARKILMHKKTQEACKKFIEGTSLAVEIVDSNGEAARRVAECPEYVDCLALGPVEAGQKYQLKVLKTGCEDKTAVTTFFLIGPRHIKPEVRTRNKMLVAFSLKHQRGALVSALKCLRSFNLTHIHSVHIGDGHYHFVVEAEIGSELSKICGSIKKLTNATAKLIIFGPFAVLQG